MYGKKTEIFLWLPFLFFLALLSTALRPIEGFIGHDYYHEFSRLYFGSAFFWQNGLHIPHYIPSLCGGIPFFADPQNSYFSFPQLLSFFLDPFLASRLTILFFYFLGYWGCLYFFKARMKVSLALAHLGGLLFIFNGFSFSHLFVGHLTHHSYLLIPWFLYFFFSPFPAETGRIQKAAQLSLVPTYMFYSGGMHMLVVLGVLAILIYPIGRFVLPDRKAKRQQLFFLLTATGLVLLGCSGKLMLEIAYSRQFAVGAIDSSEENFLVVLLRYFWFIPSWTPLNIVFGRIQFGPWEYIGFISKLTLPAFAVFLWTALKRKWFSPSLFWGYGGLVTLVALISAGSEFNSLLPFFRHYHNPIKILSAFIPLLVGSTVYVLAVAKVRLTSGVFYLTAGVLLIEFSISASFFLNHRTGITYPYDAKPYAAFKAERKLPVVTQVVRMQGADLDAVRGGASNLHCYEPLFGYALENLKTEVVEGSTTQMRGGRFNLNHPGCLLYPEHFGCQAWDRIPMKEIDNFERFTSGIAPRWELPWMPRVVLLFNGLCLIATMLLAIFPFRIGSPPQS